MEPIRAVMAGFAIIGAFGAVSLSPEIRMMGFCSWILSNRFLLIDYYKARDYPWVAVFMIYEILNVVGVLNNWSAI